jgi:hypothetical protein
MLPHFFRGLLLTFPFRPPLPGPTLPSITILGTGTSHYTPENHYELVCFLTIGHPCFFYGPTLSCLLTKKRQPPFLQLNSKGGDRWGGGGYSTSCTSTKIFCRLCPVGLVLKTAFCTKPTVYIVRSARKLRARRTLCKSGFFFQTT